MITYVFPGQGSQKVGMGEGLFDAFPEVTSRADDILGYSIRELCLEGPRERLTRTEHTQAALFVVSALAYMKKRDADGEPDFAAGHSLGEYNALLAAGAFDFETGLRLVQKRGELMSRALGGGMAAVIGMTDDRVREVLAESGLDRIDVANYNAPGQVVISGLKEDVEGAKGVFETAGARLVMPLNVGGAFHSRYMEDSRKAFQVFLDDFDFSDLQLPVISNVQAAPYTRRKLKGLLSDQLTGAVRWTETIQYLKARGCERFEELGPGEVLTNLIGKIKLD